MCGFPLLGFLSTTCVLLRPALGPSAGRLRELHSRAAGAPCDHIRPCVSPPCRLLVRRAVPHCDECAHVYSQLARSPSTRALRHLCARASPLCKLRNIMDSPLLRHVSPHEKTFVCVETSVKCAPHVETVPTLTNSRSHVEIVSPQINARRVQTIANS